MAEIAFETLRLALETTRGTAIAAPTHLLNMAGKITPKITQHRTDEARGTRAMNYRHVATRKGMEWEAEGDADVRIMPLLLNMGVMNLSAGVTPGAAPTAKLWAFINNISADNIKSATAWWGDPALNQLISDFVMLDEITLENDASKDEGVLTVKVKGQGGVPTKVAAPAATAAVAGATMPGQLMQCWIDSGSAIGTTAITGRVISAKHTIKTGVKYKFVAGGPTGTLDFALVGREKIAGLTTELKLEFIDYTEYDLWAAGTDLKVRVRHNGSFIETATTDFYNYLEVDSYGPATDLSWDDNEGSNRALNLTIESQYDSTLASDFRVAVQNVSATL